MFLSKKVCTALALASIVLSPIAKAGILYSNGFETDPNRVASGTDGITAASGSYFAKAVEGSYTTWGGYNFGAGGGVPTAFQEYSTSIDIYLNVAGGWANGSGFDFSSSINNNSGNFLRDFIFNGGFYNSSDITGPGAGTDRFVISASNNSQPTSAYPKNPGRGPIAIDTTGWYTFENNFMDVGGFLSVDMNIFDSSHNLVNSWTLGGTDAISGVGGNRYGWFDYLNNIPYLAVDNLALTVPDTAAPEPADIAIFVLGLMELAVIDRKRRNI